MKTMIDTAEPRKEAPIAPYDQILDYEVRSASARLPIRLIPTWAMRVIGDVIGKRVARKTNRKYIRYQWSLDNSKYVREHKSLYDALDKSKAMKKAGVLTKDGHFKKP